MSICMNVVLSVESAFSEEPNRVYRPPMLCVVSSGLQKRACQLLVTPAHGKSFGIVYPCPRITFFGRTWYTVDR